MRDLSKTPLGNPRRRSSPLRRLKKLLALVLLVLLIFLIARLWLNLGNSSGSAIILREAARGLVPVELSNQHEQLTSKAVDLVTQRAILVDVKYDGRAAATATRSFGGGTYILTVEATLPDPKNVSYQVWVTGGGEVIPIDYMRGEKTNWSLSVRTGDEFSNYDGIWITLERTKDEIPEEHVMEGSF